MAGSVYKLGGETRVNTTIGIDQGDPSIAALANNGGWIVTWEAPDGAKNGIYQQRYDMNGNPVGSETRINTHVTEDQQNPVVTGLSDGGWVVAWQSYAQVSGTAASNWDVYQQRFDAEGAAVGLPQLVNTAATGDNQSIARIAAYAGGGWVVTWTSKGQDGSGFGVYQQVYDKDGEPKFVTSVPDSVNFKTDGDQVSSSVATLSNGHWVIAWQHYDAASNTTQIIQRIYDENGVGGTGGGEVKVSVDNSGQYLSGNQTEAAVTALAMNGGWVVTWTSETASGNDIYYQRYSFGGVPEGLPERVNTTPSNAQQSSSVAALPDGGWVVVWQSTDGANWDIYQQCYDKNGNAVGGEVLVNTTTDGTQAMSRMGVTALSDGSWVVTWESADIDGSGWTVFQQRFTLTTNDVFKGSASGDTLEGTAGADTLEGGFGDDGYIVNMEADVVKELPGGGTDTILTSVSYTLAGGASVEFLTAAGAMAIDLTGNELDNTLTGNAAANKLAALGGDDTLDGGVGTDTLEGGLGDDVYHVDDAGDTVTEAASEGTDTVVASVDFTLKDNLENLTASGTRAVTLDGNGLANRITGNATANTLRGRGGDDTLDGGAGADILGGGVGNDTYIVDNAGDIVIEIAAEGTDTVVTSIAYALSDHVEHLTAAGTGAIALTGNDLANLMTGNAAANAIKAGAQNDTLDGGAGADILTGGTGDDTYVVDDAGDKVTEAASEGIDTVISSISYTLAKNVEILTAAGTDAVALTGNTLANTIRGEAQSDTLDGGAGADILIGKAGNDTYLVDNAGDEVIEVASEGVDTVMTSISYTLADNSENLTASGAAAVALTGNALANILKGNELANVLDGRAGADTLEGGSGDDTYYVDDSGDVVNDTAGVDTVFASVSYALAAGAAVEALNAAGANAVDLKGNAGSNQIIGNGAANRLSGGLGKDMLTGGAGKDTFVFDTKLGVSNVDRIVDFNVKDDTIWLDNKYMPKLGKGSPTKPLKLNKGFFTVGPKAKDKDDYLVYDNKKGVLFYDADGSGAKAAVAVATLKKGLKMTYADFFVI